MKGSRLLILAVSYLLIVSLLAPRPVLSQQSEPPQPPSDPNATWNPPQPSGTGNSGGPYPLIVVTPGGGGAAAAWTTDYQYNKKDHFTGSETLYLWFVSPFSCYWFWWYEYYPPGNLPQGHWIPPYWGYGPISGAGTYILGPLSPEPSEPYGLHVERIWLLDCASFSWADTLARWSYDPPAPAEVRTNVQVSLSQTQTSPGQAVSVSASVSPVPTGGTMSISVSQNGAQWTVINSGSASTGSVSTSWSPPGPGTYAFKASFTGYTDTAANKQYDQTESSIATLNVDLTATTLTLIVSPTAVSIDSLTKATQSVTLTGILMPTIQSALVVVMIDGPTGRTVKTEVAVAGAFSDSFTPAQSGTYTISASYQGDATHKPSQASPQTVTVSENPTNLYLLILGGVAVAAVAIFLVMRRRGRISGPPPYPPTRLPPTGMRWNTCPNCGTSSKPTASFCRHCRTRLR